MFSRQKVAANHRPDTGPASPAGSDLIIHAEQVVKTYDTGIIKVEALRNVDFAVKRGEMVAVMGPSGCGKTTLLNCLSGLDTIDSGTVRIEGTDISTLGDRDRTAYRAKRMGFVFQVFNLLPVLSAEENVELPLLVGDVRPSEARVRAREALDKVGLLDRADHRPAELSGGERQRVTIARSLVNNPAIVWADEPTGSLDSVAANEIMDLLKDLSDNHGWTIVLVTHDEAVGNMCDRIVRMRDGEIVGEEIPERGHLADQPHAGGTLVTAG
jgi:putative ABC transport system ATP-binding protein